MNTKDLLRLLILGFTVYLAKQADALPRHWCAKLYQDKNYDLTGSNDDYLTVYPTDDGELDKAVGSHTGKKRQWNDKTSSIKVKPGCSFEAFENHNKEKRMWEINLDIDNLILYGSDSWEGNIVGNWGNAYYNDNYQGEAEWHTSNDKISSYKCTCT